MIANDLTLKVHRAGREAGFSAIEFLTTLAISSLLLTASLSTFTHLAKVANDHEHKIVAQLQAQNVIDMIVPEIRMIGNGVPFHQSNFLIAQANLADNTVTQPILVANTDDRQLSFRLNETGETYIVTADFNPSSSSTVTLSSVSKIFDGDQVYITNSTVGEDEGFWGMVTAVNSGAKTVTFAANAQYSPEAIFAKGSLLEVVPIVTYTSAEDFGGITRDSGLGALTLVPNGEFSLEYLNSAGNVIALPLVASAVDPFPASSIQNVRAIRVSVSVKSAKRLSTGEYYVAQVIQTVGVRNLNYKY